MATSCDVAWFFFFFIEMFYFLNFVCLAESKITPLYGVNKAAKSKNGVKQVTFLNLDYLLIFYFPLPQRQD